MIISNEHQTRRIELIRTDALKEHAPSHQVQVRIETEYLQTTFDNYTWLLESDIEQFITNLTTLDQSRTGQAILESMSPGELKLTFLSINTQGHIAVNIHLKKAHSHEIIVAFEIDPTSLPTVRNELLALIK